MKRYNHDGIPMPMVEAPEGYWVTYEDYNQSMLDNNKLVEKSWRARNSLAVVDEIKLEKMHDIIVALSAVCFVSISLLIFIGLS
jgi:hypothetical protein